MLVVNDISVSVMSLIVPGGALISALVSLSVGSGLDSSGGQSGIRALRRNRT